MSDKIWTKQKLLAKFSTERTEILLTDFKILFEDRQKRLGVRDTDYFFNEAFYGWYFYSLVESRDKIDIGTHGLSMILEDPNVPNQVKENFLFHISIFR